MPRIIAESYSLSIADSYDRQWENQQMLTRHKKTVWDRVEEALRDKRMEPTQAKAAQLAGISQPSVNKWTKPGKYPAMDTCVLLAEKLGVCVEWLYSGRGPKHPGEHVFSDLGEIADFWERLPLEVRAEIVGFAKYKRSMTFTGDPERRDEYQESISQKKLREE